MTAEESKAMRNIVRIFALAACALCAFAAAAQNYPARPVRVVVSFPPGAGVDIVARTITPRLTEAFGPAVRGGQPGPAPRAISAPKSRRTP